MAGQKLRGVKLQGNSYWVRMAVPKDVAHMFPTGELWENLHTGNPHDAAKMAPPILAGFKKLIADARAGRTVARQPPHWLKNLGWILSGKDDFTPVNGASAALQTPWSTTEQLLNLEAITEGKSEGGPEFDVKVAAVLGVSPDHPSVAAGRKDVAFAMLAGERVREQTRLAQLYEGRAVSLRNTMLDVMETPVIPPFEAKPLPPPSLTLRKLFDQWKSTLTVSEKERGRLEHQIRRLIEVVGDKPANHLTKAEVRDFMSLVTRFPRKRSAELNALPMEELIERFDAIKAAIAARNAERVERSKATGARPNLEEMPTTLTATTVDEWFGCYRRMFDYAVVMLDFDSNPFVAATKKYVVKGAEPTKRREFTEAEIKYIFGSPMFNGFEGDGERGYRNKPGSTIIRDAKYWLPILALHHGGRLTEFAAMPHADVKQTPAGTWYFDLLDRKVKNETSKRPIPVHPKMIGLGFLDYVATVRAGNSPWLFPDLNHETRHGPGHAFSKWWGNWMDAMGLTDPSLAHHSWRHTFKRAARQSEVKEEIHDVLTGHKGGTVSRQYGEGADIEPLAREMAKIVFPAFPDLPVPSLNRKAA